MPDETPVPTPPPADTLTLDQLRAAAHAEIERAQNVAGAALLLEREAHAPAVRRGAAV